MKYEVFYNKLYAHSCNLIQKTVKGSQLYIDKVNNILLIDNCKVADLKEVNQIRFLVNGYYQVINVASPYVKLEATDIEYPTKEVK